MDLSAMERTTFLTTDLVFTPPKTADRMTSAGVVYSRINLAHFDRLKTSRASRKEKSVSLAMVALPMMSTRSFCELSTSSTTICRCFFCVEQLPSSSLSSNASFSRDAAVSSCWPWLPLCCRRLRARGVSTLIAKTVTMHVQNRIYSTAAGRFDARERTIESYRAWSSANGEALTSTASQRSI